MAKKRAFRMHPTLLFQTIQRQAGTLAKAITEGVMNSVEAGATRVDIRLDEETVWIEDDGRGFQSLEEIENWFETFGMPHDASENKIWANFRIGRGQLFSFGRNIWRTQRYEMRVDFQAAVRKGDTLGYELRELEQESPGCLVHIDLYRKLLPSDLRQTEVDLRLAVKWVSVPVYLNDNRISQDPSQAKWDYEDDLCCMKLRKRGNLVVYNKGVFVREYPERQFGCGGDVVSKQQLLLNQARNDVLVQHCEVWRQVRKQVNKFIGREIRRRPSLSDSAKDYLALQMIDGALSEKEFRELKLFTDVTGRGYNWRGLLNRMTKSEFYTEGERYDRISDEIHEQKIAFVFAQECLDRFQVSTAEELFEKLRLVAPVEDIKHWPWTYRTLQELSSGFNRDFRLVAAKSLSVNEKIILELCQKTGGLLVGDLRVRADTDICERRYVVGISDVADGWTDGSSFIAINRRWLQRRRFTRVTDLLELGALLLHEYCHEDSDTDSHTHSPEFYRKYHDASEGLGYFVETAVMALPRIWEKFDKKINRTLARTLDKIEIAKRLLLDLENEEQRSRVMAARASELKALEAEVKKRKRAKKKGGK